VNELLQEIEAHTHAKVVDIPHVSAGSNNMVSCSLSYLALRSLVHTDATLGPSHEAFGSTRDSCSPRSRRH
jgi:hypothetical protein